jgi:hypothetical protein
MKAKKNVAASQHYFQWRFNAKQMQLYLANIIVPL